ncbi:MAG: ketosteroid isomerase [Acidimicrobiia bacterium]|nr:MAG: ketosteroid isomerase [Acidimicrobiia bacterium]
MTSPDVRAVVEAYVGASNRNDKPAVLALFAPDAVWHDPVGAPPHVGHEGIGAFFDQARQMADRLELRVKDVIECGNEAAALLEIEATIGDGGMILDVVETFELDDAGRIRLMKAYWDMTRARPRP